MHRQSSCCLVYKCCWPAVSFFYSLSILFFCWRLGYLYSLGRYGKLFCLRECCVSFLFLIIYLLLWLVRRFYYEMGVLEIVLFSFFVQGQGQGLRLHNTFDVLPWWIRCFIFCLQTLLAYLFPLPLISLAFLSLFPLNIYYLLLIEKLYIVQERLLKLQFQCQ